MLGQPSVEIEIVILLGPHHPGKRLTMDATFVLAQLLRSDAVIKLVGIRETAVEYLIKGIECVGWSASRSAANAQPCFLPRELPAHNARRLWFRSSPD